MWHDQGNESDVADVVSEILAKKEVKFVCFILFSVLITHNCITRLPIIILNLRYASKCSISKMSEKERYKVQGTRYKVSKTQNWKSSTCDSFPLIMSHFTIFDKKKIRKKSTESVYDFRAVVCIFCFWCTTRYDLLVLPSWFCSYSSKMSTLIS